MKFLFVAASHRHGGAEIQFVTLTRALASSGHTVEVVVFPDAPIARLLAGSLVRVHFARFRNAVDLRGYWRTMIAARRLQPDWLVGGTGKEHLATVTIGRLLGIPVVLIRHRLGMKRYQTGCRAIRVLARRSELAGQPTPRKAGSAGPGVTGRLWLGRISPCWGLPDAKGVDDLYRYTRIARHSALSGPARRRGVVPLFHPPRPGSAADAARL